MPHIIGHLPSSDYVAFLIIQLHQCLDQCSRSLPTNFEAHLLKHVGTTALKRDVRNTNLD